MIAYSIERARSSGLFDRVIVSTDDAEIATVARDWGAEVPFMRPAALADDHAGTTAVMAHAIEWLQNNGCTVMTACCIYATAPFIRSEDLQRGLALLQTNQWQFVFAATTFAAPVHRSFRQRGDGGLEMIFPEYFQTRSQDLPLVLHDAAQFYWGARATWMSDTRMFDRGSTVVTIPRWRVQDIDTEEDWLRAESMARQLGISSQANTDIPNEKA